MKEKLNDSVHYLSSEQVAKRLRVSRPWVYHLEKTGALTSQRFGAGRGFRVYAESNVEQYLERLAHIA